MTQDIDDVLEHYGVKGMRWGVRRSQAELDRAAGRRISKGKPVTMTNRNKKIKKKKKGSEPTVVDVREAELSTDFEEAARINRKIQQEGIQSLSNDELRNLNKRLELEKKYKDITKPKPPEQKKKSEGQKQAEKLAMDMALKVTRDVTSKAIEELLKKHG